MLTPIRMPLPQPPQTLDSQGSETEEEGDSPPKLLPLPSSDLEKDEEKEMMGTMQRPFFPVWSLSLLGTKPVYTQTRLQPKSFPVWASTLALKQLLEQTTLVLRVSAHVRRLRKSDPATVRLTWRQAEALSTFHRRLPALVQGWKTRRVLGSWFLSVCMHKVQAALPSDRPLCVAELKHVFVEEYRSGKWMRARKRPRPFLKRNAMQHTYSPLQEPLTTAETSSPSPQSARPFLKRKSKRVLSQQLSYHAVPTRVNCWHRVTPKRSTSCLKRNSLEEFVALEKRSQARTQQKLPVPQTEIPLRRHLGLGALKVCISEAELQRPQVQPRLFKLEPKKDPNYV